MYHLLNLIKSSIYFPSSHCRPLGFWLSKAQSLLYCNEHGVPGSFSEEVKSCICPVEHPTCQGVIPCSIGTSSTSCSSCAADNATRCGACHHGNILHLGSCRPSIAASLDHYLSFDLDMPDAEVLKKKFYDFSNASQPCRGRIITTRSTIKVYKDVSLKNKKSKYSTLYIVSFGISSLSSPLRFKVKHKYM